jgi:protein AroM
MVAHMRMIGAITIGQAPRDDVVPEMEKLLGAGVRVLQAGALDGLSRVDVAGLAPAPDEDALITRLTDGSEVIVAKRKILGRLQACVDRLGPETEACVILCAGKFPPFHSARPVLLPDRLLAAAVDAVWEGGRLGVIVPIAQQREAHIALWGRVDPGVVVTVASPYRGAPDVMRAAEELRAAGVTLTVMSCLGFTSATKTVVRDVTGAPALLPISLIARFLSELA